MVVTFSILFGSERNGGRGGEYIREMLLSGFCRFLDNFSSKTPLIVAIRIELNKKPKINLFLKCYQLSSNGIK